MQLKGKHRTSKHNTNDILEISIIRFIYMKLLSIIIVNYLQCTPSIHE